MANDIVPSPNISDLARRLGVSRTTVRRRLAAGWTPTIIEGEIVEQDQELSTPSRGVDLQVDTPLDEQVDVQAGEHACTSMDNVVHLPADTARITRQAIQRIAPGKAQEVPAVLLSSTGHLETARAFERTHGRRWRATGRILTGLALAGCGVAIAVTSIRANAWFGHSLTSDPLAGEIFARLSVLAEITACVIPTANRFYWQDGDRWTAIRGFMLMAVALAVVFFAASGFVLNMISTGVETRGDRITPAVELAQRTADTLARSRADECRRRGDHCRALEAEERKALADLAAARAEVRIHADPQAEAMHVDSNTVRTVQAAALVLMCLCAGYLISLGAGLVFPKEKK